MQKRKKARHFNLPLFLILKATYEQFLKYKYNVHVQNRELLKQLKPPFILVPNHVALLDPPIVNIFIHHRIHFVMADANLRTRFTRWVFIKLAAVIPKTKATSDSTTVRQLIKFARAKHVLCVFPEGRASWDGLTHDIFFSTAKLLKALKIPVVVPLIHGGYLSQPRWSPHMRRGKIIIDYQKLFDGPECADMSAEDIFEELTKKLYHNDYEFQKRTGILYKSKRGAEYLERLLFICPHCKEMMTLRSEGNRFLCTHCGFENRWTEEGLLEPVNDQNQPVRRVYEWSQWQLDVLEAIIRDRQSVHSDKPLFEDKNVTLKTGYKYEPLKERLTGTMRLFVDRFQLEGANGQKEVFAIDDIYGVQVLLGNNFEFYRGQTLYKFQFDNERTSGYKYMAAVQKMAPEKAELE